MQEQLISFETAKLAAENVKITKESQERLDGSCCCNYVEIDKQSILDTINQIE